MSKDVKRQDFTIGKTYAELCEQGSKGVSYSELLLRPPFTSVSPEDPDLDFSAPLGKGITTSNPMDSAIMDTVTNGLVASKMGLAGGVGVIYRGHPKWSGSQLDELKFLKNYKAYIVRDPVTVSPNTLVRDVRDMRDQNHQFHAFPVTKEGKSRGELLGFIGKNDYLPSDYGKKVSEVMVEFNDLVTADPNIGIDDAEEIFRSKRVSRIILEEDHNLAGLLCRKDFSDSLESYGDKRPTLAKDGTLFGAVGVGVNDDIDYIWKLIENGANGLWIDNSHGNSISTVNFLKQTYDLVKRIRKKLTDDVILHVGNMGTGDDLESVHNLWDERFEEAHMLEIDGVKYGMGPGSICTTRGKSGVGVTQAMGIYSAAARQEKLGTDLVITADGGFSEVGHIGKAIALGAHRAQSGRLFAPAYEAPGPKQVIDGVEHKLYRGMGSASVIKENVALTDRYDSSRLPQGVEGWVPVNKEGIHGIMGNIEGSLKLTLAHCDCKNLEELREYGAGSVFTRQTSGSVVESGIHNLTIKKEG